MEDALHHMQQALEGLEEQLLCLAKSVGDLKREEEAILEQSSRRNLGVHSMHNNQWGYDKFSPYSRAYEHRNGYNDRSCREFQEMKRRMGAKPIKTWSLMKQALRITFRVENHEGQGQGSEFYANGTNSFFATEFFCVHNFEDSSKDNDGKLAYKSIKTINIFHSNSYLSFEIYFKEIKLFSLVFVENGYEFYFLNSLGTLLEKKIFIELNSLSCDIRRIYEYYEDVANYASCVLGIEDEERGKEKELCICPKDL
ncbi:hypothetical protein M9H77_23318 [Catharanthus roseus]|uniref:Uncharacterized protein n=1 Tax=Catharanthus roseus TaxID=4058 RepID=A0ACC0AUN9_CATRO|nr:hypothetical protein M9H77_23318 [Catharanthus roseus]